MIRELQNLSQSAATVNSDQVERVMTSVCRKIDEFLNAKLIRVYRKDRARTATLLKPFAIISDGEVHVETISIADQPQGVISWCVHKEEPVWIEDLQRLDKETPALNRATDAEIPSEYLEFSYNPDSVLVLPLKAEGELIGVIVIELDRSNVFTEAIFNEFEKICISLGRLLCNSNIHQNHLADTTKAIEQFLNSLLGYEFPNTLKTGNIRTGFIARPFNGRQDLVGSVISDDFKKARTKAIHYQPLPNSGMVVLGIIEQIRNAHFYVVDLTDLNRNVLLEFGLILSNEKNESKCLLIRDKEDKEDLPFDVVGFPVHRYQFNSANSTLDVWTSGGEVSESFYDVLQRFLEGLESDPEFRAAKPYEG